jgi:hypothetical protein
MIPSRNRNHLSGKLPEVLLQRKRGFRKAAENTNTPGHRAKTSLLKISLIAYFFVKQLRTILLASLE